MTSPKARPAVVERFRAYLARHREGARAVGWGSAASQARRFEVLNGIAPLAGQSILDLGCGLGHFLGWLKARGIAVDYVGLDITPEMVESARAAHPEARFENGSVEDFLVREPQPAIDYAFASG